MKLKLAFAFAMLALFASAQKNPSQINVNFSDGTLAIEQYASSIFKVTYHSANYRTNENITNAVILKPFSKINHSVINADEGKLSFEKNGKASFINIVHKNGYTALQFALDKEEMIFGGGERALPLNRRGYSFNLYNNPWYGYGEGADNLNYSVPFFTSSKGYGLFFDNASKGYADIGKTQPNTFEAGFISGEINAFVILGNDYKTILTSYQKLTGTQPLPPRWALGNLMSRFGYTSEKQVKEIATKMKQEHIPFHAIIFDLFWFGDSIKGSLGNLDWVNKNNWPHPEKMISDLSKEHINTILITEPFMLQNTKRYNASLPYLAKDSAGKPFIIPDFYFGKGGLIDIFRKDAGDWIWNVHYKKQIANGVKGWWTDLGEPEKHPSAMLHNAKDAGVQRMLGADEVHNIYGHYWNKNLYEHYATDFPNERLFHLNRSGFAGSPRYSIFPWTGDVSRSWSGFRAQLPNLLSMSMSGVPYAHSDAGGFAGGEGDNELYIRWLQFATFTPIFRPHGTALFDIDKNAYSFPSEPALIDTPYRAIAKSIVDLRYALLPYNYTLAYRQAAFGEPLMRPLYYQYPKDSIAINIANEYLWGNEMLMAPVLQKGTTEQKVYLPEGNWYRFTRDSLYTGNSWVSLPVTLKTIPCWVKAGAIIPMYAWNDSLHSGVNNLSWNYFPSSQTSAYTLFNDDGKNKNSLKENQFQLYTLHVTPEKNNYHFRFTFSGAKTVAGKKGFNWKLVLKAVHKTPSEVLINGKRMQKGIYILNSIGNNSELILPVTFKEEALNIDVLFD
jgi:oligosaccharide 4-alpha-D-glucosyltransferase